MASERLQGPDPEGASGPRRAERAGQDSFGARTRRDAADRHRGGRSVVLATFESGLVLVYKPKSLAVDRHFQETLAWMNSKAIGRSARGWQFWAA